MSRFKDWAALETWLDSRNIFHMELGLARITRALDRLGLARLPFFVVQVLGTNGKGSTAAFIDSLARAHGLTCGLYTSPHFVSITERIKIDDAPLPCEEFLDCANQVIAVAEDLTWFEFMTAVAIVAFAARGVQAAILEAGLGGASDATSAACADVQCFTPIAMDHAAIIGPGLCDIAADKARAIRPGARVVQAGQYPVAESAIRAHAQAVGATVWQAPAQSLPPNSLLRGPFQQINAGTALRAWRELAELANISSDPEKETRGLAQAFLPGRFQRIRQNRTLPNMLIDGAHNPHGTMALLRGLAGEQDFAPDCVIYSALADKAWREACAMLARHLPHARFYIPALDNARAANAVAIAACINGINPGQAQTVSLGDALVKARGADTLLTGSLYLLGEFFSLNPDALLTPENPSLSACGANLRVGSSRRP